MINSANAITKVSFLGCIFICVFVLFSLFYLSKNTIQVSTDIKSLSPDISKEQDLQTVINRLASTIEKQFTLLLRSSDPEILEQAVELVGERLDTREYAFDLIDADETIDSLQQLLLEYRFQLLTPDQSETLAQLDNKTIIENAERRLYGLEGSLQLYTFADDPLGFLSEYTLQLARHFDRSEDVLEAGTDGAGMHYHALTFTIRGNSLNMDLQTRLQHQLQGLLAEVKTRYPNITFAKSGVVFFATEAAQNARRDISIISFGSTVGILLLLISVFRSITPLILPLVSIAIGIAFAFSVSHMLYGSVHIITIVFGAGLIGVVIDYALHYFYHRQHGMGMEPALHTALGFSLLTSVIGYSALALSNLEALRHIAVFSVLGLIGAWVSVIALGGLVVRRPITRRDGLLVTFVKAAKKFLKRTPSIALAASVAIVAALFAYHVWNGLKTSDDPRIFFSPSQSLIEQEAMVGRAISAFEPGAYLIVRAADVQNVYDELTVVNETLRSSNTLSIQNLLPSPREQGYYYRQLTPIYAAEGPALQFMRKQNLSDTATHAVSQAHLQSRNAILLPTELQSTLDGRLPSLWQEYNKNHYAFILLPRGFDRDSVALVANASDKIFFIDTASMAKDTIAEQRRAASLQLTIAFLLIALLVTLRYRRLSKIVLMLVPGVSIMLTLLLLHYLGMPVTLFHVMAMFLVLGLGMDYVIFVSELGRQHDGTLQAIMLSALTSVLSFGLLGLSSLPIVQAFGITVLIGNSLNLVGAIVLATWLSRDTARHRRW